MVHDAPEVPADQPQDSAEGTPLSESTLRSFVDLLFHLAAGRRNGRLVVGPAGQELELFFANGFLETVDSLHRPGLMVDLLTGLRRPLDKRLHSLSDDVKLDGYRLVGELLGSGALAEEELVSLFARHLHDVLTSVGATAGETLGFHTEPQGEGELPTALHVLVEPVLQDAFLRTQAFGLGAGILGDGEPAVLRTGAKLGEDVDEIAAAIHGLANGDHSISDIAAQIDADPLVFAYHFLSLRAQGLILEAGPERLLLLGAKARSEGRLDLAIRFYERAKAAGSGDPTVFRELGLIYDIMGRAEEACANHLEFAHHCRDEGRTAEAEELYRKVLVQNPNQPDALALVASLAMERGDREKALEISRRLVEVGTTSGDWRLAHRARRVLIEGGGCRIEIFDAYFDGIRRENDRDRAVEDLRFLYSNLIRANHQDKARMVLGRLLAIDGGLLDERYDLAVLLLESGHTDDARRELASLHQALAAQAPEEGSPRWELLKKVCEVLVRVDPDHVEARTWLTVACRTTLEETASHEHLDWLMSHHVSTLDVEPLLELLRGMLVREPDARPIRDRLVSTLVRAGRREEAALEILGGAPAEGGPPSRIALLGQALEIDPFLAVANDELVRILREEGGGQKLLAPLHRLALAHTTASRFEAARESYREILTLCPDDPSLHAELVRLEEWTGNHQALARAARGWLGACLQKGDQGSARTALARLKEVASDHPELPELTLLLEGMAAPNTPGNAAAMAPALDTAPPPAAPVVEPAAPVAEATSPVASPRVGAFPAKATGFVSVSPSTGGREPEAGPAPRPAPEAAASQKTETAEPTSGQESLRSPREAQARGGGGQGDDFASIVSALKAVQIGGGPGKTAETSENAPRTDEASPDEKGFRSESAEDSIGGIVANLRAMKGKD